MITFLVKHSNQNGTVVQYEADYECAVDAVLHCLKELGVGKVSVSKVERSLSSIIPNHVQNLSIRK